MKGQHNTLPKHRRVPASPTEYHYLGDRMTADEFRGKKCRAVYRANGKCVRGRNGNMLVSFNDKMVVVMARMLRKINEASLLNK